MTSSAATQAPITFDNEGCSLAGTITDVPAPSGAALLIVGSGRTDRDSDVRLPLHQVLRGGITRSLARSLAAAGIASLRFDKRGVGASGGDYFTAGMEQRASDARAALAELARRYPGLPLLAIGHSEGTYYAAQLAAGMTGSAGPVAGAALLAGPARTGAEINAWQVEQLASRLPASARVILRLMRTDAARSQRKNQDRIMASTSDTIRLQGQRVSARWIRDFVRYDPAPVLAKVTVPVLAVTGGHDLQVPPADVAAIGKLVQGPFEGHVVGDLSHMLRPDPGSAGPRGYRKAMRLPVSQDVLDLVSSWAARITAPVAGAQP